MTGDGGFHRAFLLDSCRTDCFAGMDGRGGGVTRDLDFVAVPECTEESSSYFLLRSCDKFRPSLELDGIGHGLFTQALLDAMDAHDGRLASCDTLFATVVGAKMADIQRNYNVNVPQRPSMGECSGPVFSLFENGFLATAGRVSPQQLPTSSRAVTAFVTCPMCERKNSPENTFRCCECGRDNLCLRHQDEATFLCVGCASKRKAREVREESLRNGTCLETGICRMIVLPGGVKMEMIYCPPGEFMMGSPATEEGRSDNETQHRVRLTKGFWLGKYPITQDQWRSVMHDNPSAVNGNSHPVENVTWENCQEFIKKVNVQLNCCARLPTETVWEYACRAGTNTPYSFGGALNGDMANCDGGYPYGTQERGRYIGGTTPVGRCAENPWGFYDMHGNMWEWCADRYGDYPTRPMTDPIVDPYPGFSQERRWRPC